MSVINGPGQSLFTPLIVPEAPETGAPAQSGQNNAQVLPPIYASSFSGLTTAMGLGLASPRNQGDIEAIFAEVAEKLDKINSVTRDNERVADSNSRRTSLQTAGVLFSQMNGVGALVESNKDNIKDQNAKIEDVNGQITVLEAQRSMLTATRDSLNGQLNGLQSQRNSLYNTLGTLQSELQTLQQQLSQLQGANPQNQAAIIAKQDQIAGKWNQIGGVNGQISTVDWQISTVSGQIATLNNQINGINGQINGLVNERNVAQASKNKSEQDIEDLNAAYAVLVATVMPYATAQMTGSNSSNARISGQTNEIVSDYDQLMEQVLDNLTDLADRILELNFIARGAQEGRAGASGDGTALPSSFGQLSPVQALAAGFVGLIQALRDTLGGLAGGDNLATAGALGQGGGSRMQLAL